jgi:hypothetical protein
MTSNDWQYLFESVTGEIGSRRVTSHVHVQQSRDDASAFCAAQQWCLQDGHADANVYLIPPHIMDDPVKLARVTPTAIEPAD